MIRKCMMLAFCVSSMIGLAPALAAHIFIWPEQRSGAPPCKPGTGWFVECFWGIPDETVKERKLLGAEEYAETHDPTFTFHADYIDWPEGAVSHAVDTSFTTMGDFLDGHISELSDPDALKLPFDRHFLLRATGNVRIRLGDSSFDDVPPPVYFDMGIVAPDGGRIRIELTTVVNLRVPEPPPSFTADDATTDLPGVYPITLTYLQWYDPEGEFGAERAGLELLSCHEDGLELRSGEHLRYRCLTRAGRGMPPWYIYAREDLKPILDGDFEVDGDVDLRDFAYFQKCFTGPDNQERLIEGCFTFDFDEDDDVDLEDYRVFVEEVTGPNGCW